MDPTVVQERPHDARRYGPIRQPIHLNQLHWLSSQPSGPGHAAALLVEDSWDAFGATSIQFLWPEQKGIHRQISIIYVSGFQKERKRERERERERKILITGAKSVKINIT